MTDEEYMMLALNEAKKCSKANDVPVGAVIVIDNKIVAKAHNTRELKQLTVGHAEINAISKANKKVNRCRLDGGTIYITKEPCLMCMGSILSARLDKIVYGAKDLRYGTENFATDNNFNHKCEIVGGVLEKECSSLISSFFKSLRGNNENRRKINSITKEKIK